MLYSFILLEKPGAPDLRLQMRLLHNAYLARVEKQIAFAGPLTNDHGLAVVGTLLVMNFNSLQEAQAWLNAEPLNGAGLYDSTSVHAFVNLWPQKALFPTNT